MKTFPNEYTEDIGNNFRSEDMSFTTNLFGIRIVKGERGKISSTGYVAELYIEDDEHYIFKASFDAFWLKDLHTISTDVLDVWNALPVTETSL